jgi:hypothetical protein
MPSRCYVSNAKELMKIRGRSIAAEDGPLCNEGPYRDRYHPGLAVHWAAARSKHRSAASAGAATYAIVFIGAAAFEVLILDTLHKVFDQPMMDRFEQP